MLQNTAEWQENVDQIASGNVDRHTKAQGYVAGIYFLMGMMVLQAL